MSNQWLKLEKLIKILRTLRLSRKNSRKKVKYAINQSDSFKIRCYEFRYRCLFRPQFMNSLYSLCSTVYKDFFAIFVLTISELLTKTIE